MKPTMNIRFDDSLPAMAKVLIEELGTTALEAGMAVRDTSGRLAFFAAEALEPQRLGHIAQRLAETLGPYARSDRVLANASDPGAARILNEAGFLTLEVCGAQVRLLDRRLVGADWLRRPLPIAPSPPRFVFASLKGGVGRSTALAVAAAALAAKGRRVLAIDLDMEAPGLGAMLLDEGTVPEFGIVDALVENGFAPLDDTFLADLIGPSALADRHGRIDVLPAFGRRSLNHPGDVLAKLARAYADDLRADGSPATLLDQVRELVDRLADARRYDAILVDARAGLHETTASAILGLGAHVFLFGLDEPQTFQGYEFLLAHLARLATPEGASGWLERLTMVQGRAPHDGDLRSGFADRCRSMFEGAGLTRNIGLPVEVQLPAEPFHDVPWDDTSPLTDDELLPWDDLSMRQPLAILDDPRYRNFAPAIRRDLLQDAVYRSTFGTFVDQVFEVAGL
jgi:hypothetical protein